MFLPAFTTADVTVAYDVEAEGRRFEPTWGLDLAWINEQNLRKGVNHMGKENIGIGRTSFRVLNPLINDTGLTNDQIEGLRERSNLFSQAVSATLPLVLNCDNGYKPTGHTGSNINSYYTTNRRANVRNWAAAIAAHLDWMKQNTKHPIVGVSPFNEPDYDTAELAQGTAADERDVANYLRQNYQDAMDGVTIAGPNTLNNDKALDWYTVGRQYYDWGNTHQLAGSFDNFVEFYDQLAHDGKTGYDDEMHNTVEAMVGLEHGMTVGIWWGFDSRTRGEFCQISRNGVRLAYGEHRGNWTAASVYRHDDGRVKAFIGSSERQAKTTSYQLLSTAHEVYYDGYGPVREFVSVIPGGNGYQQGQTNAERVIDVTWGEDVPRAVVDGTYRIVCKKSGGVVAWQSNGGNIVLQRYNPTSKKQQWSVRPCTNRSGGDLSFVDIESVDNPMVRLNVKNYSLSMADIIAWTQTTPTSNEQWYLEYAGNGWYYVRNRESALYMAATSDGVTSSIAQRNMLPEATRDRMLFRLLPVDAVYDTQAPAQPQGLAAQAHSAAVSLTWESSTEDDFESYMVMRASKGSSEWNTIARGLTLPAFTDNTCRPGIDYLYKVQALDKAYNRSVPSVTAEATPTGQRALVAWLQMEGNTYDMTANMMDGAPCGTPVYVNDGQQGLALRLDNRSSQYLQLPYEVAGSKELTVAMWVRWRGSSPWTRLFDFGNDDSHYMYLTPVNGQTNVMRLAIRNGADEQTLDCKTRLTAQQWKHVAIVIGQGRTAIYVDGEEAGSTEAITISPADIHPTLNYLGRSQQSGDPLLIADYDDVRIYNYAVSAQEVRQIMAGKDITAAKAAAIGITAPGIFYGIDGIRRTSPGKGVNIIGGKKVLK